MNTKVRYLTIIAVGMLLAPNTAVSDKAAVVGPGARSCGQIIASMEADKIGRAAYFFWAQGFLSGLNFEYGPDFEFSTDLSDYDALMLWLENYCKENPLDIYARAVSKLWHELRARQGLEPDIRGILKDLR